MAPKIFITGITGYIGGTVADHLSKAHPEFELTAIVRSEEQANQVKSAFKNIRTVLGDLNSSDVLSKESAAADVVIHTASSDHAASATAIVDGLRKAPGTKPGYLIHTSGTGILIDHAITPGTYDGKVYDDVHDIGALTSLPDERWHRDIDRIVLSAPAAAGASRGIRTAIICPPTIYGVGTGPAKVRSDQLPRLAHAILRNRHAFTVNAGKNIWRNVHVADLADAYVLLTEEALNDGGKAGWDAQGYYFAENGEHCWGELSRLIAFYAYPAGRLTSPSIVPLSVDEIKKLEGAGPVLWGSNSRGFATRFKALGWKPYREPIAEWVPECVEFEIKNPDGAVRNNEGSAVSDLNT